MGPDREMTRREVAKFSWRDAEALPRYEAMLERLAACIEPTLPEDAAGPLVALRVTCWRWPGSASASPGWDRTAPGPRSSQGPPHASSIAGLSRRHSRRRSPPTPSSGPRRPPPCRAPPTCCSIT